MVATNLAVILAGGAGRRAALVDVDLQFGDAAGMLHVEHHPLTVADLAAHGEDVEVALLDDVLATGPAEVRVLRAPSSPELSEMIAASDPARHHPNGGQSTRIRRHRHAVTHRRVRAGGLRAGRSILLVTSYNLSAVRGTKATLLLLEALGVDLDGVDVVLNHTRPRTNYRREDIEDDPRPEHPRRPSVRPAGGSLA